MKNQLVKYPRWPFQMSIETKKKISESRQKRKLKLGYINSLQTRKKISQSLRGLKGEKSRNWQGGKPSCKICGKEIWYNSKICKKCHLTIKENHPRWKGGFATNSRKDWQRIYNFLTALKIKKPFTTMPNQFIELLKKYYQTKEVLNDKIRNARENSR